MRRPGLAGDVWPDEVQELLLRAALLRDGAGARAWAAVRPRIDVDLLPGELHRLMPLLSRSLPAQGIDEPDLPRLKGVYQYSWYRNTTLFEAAAGLASALAADGRPAVALRGTAMTLAHHRDRGLRVLRDVDLLVRAEDLEPALQMAVAQGWRPMPAARRLERRRQAVWLTRRGGHVVCLHWSPTPALGFPPPASATFWQRTADVDLHGVRVRVPSPADHLVHTVADGARANSGSSLRWIVDVVTLLEEGSVDWDVVASEARRCRLSALLADALDYVRTALERDVPAEVLRDLRRAPRNGRVLLAHRLSVTTTPWAPSAAEVLGRFLRLTADLTAYRAAAAFPDYLAAQLGVDRTGEVPRAAARKVAQVVRAPSTPAAAVSVAGRPGSSRSSAAVGARP